MVVLGFDPGYVNGCKLAVVDQNGKYLDSTVIKPFLNGNTDERIKKHYTTDGTHTSVLGAKTNGKLIADLLK